VAILDPSSHSLWVLDDAASVKPVYDLINKLILKEGYTIVYAAEPNPQMTLETMATGGINARKLVEERALRIIDRNLVFSKDNVGSADNKAKEPSFKSYFRGRNKDKGRLFIGMPEGYFGSEANFHQKLISAEQECNNIFDADLKAICLHTRAFLDSMSLSNLVKLLNAHQGIIGGKLGVKIWNPAYIIAPMRRGLDKALYPKDNANSDSDIVFRTLELIYHMDEQFIISHPDIFESTLRKMFGNSAKAILKSICDEIINEIVFDRESSNSKEVQL
jgi:hypothetical protein